MQDIKIFANEFFSFHFLEPVLARLMHKYKGLHFAILSHVSENLSDFDAYFLNYTFPIKHFDSEVITESKLGLYAHPAYLNEFGIPQKLEDLERHTVIRSKGVHATQDLGVKKFNLIEEYTPIFYKKRCVEVDSSASLMRLAEAGTGIIGLTDSAAKKIGQKLQKIPPLNEEREFIYREYIFGYSEKHRNSPLIRDIVSELRSDFC